MMEKTLILKHISRMLCLLISYSKFTRTTDNQCLKKKENNAMIERALLRKDYAYKEKETLSSKE